MTPRKHDHLRFPLAELLQDAHDLYVQCEADRPRLERTELDWDLVTRIPNVVKACSRAEAEWQAEIVERKRATSAINAIFARQRRSIASQLDALRKRVSDKKVAQTIPALRHHRTKDRQIQLLSDLSVIARHLQRILPPNLHDELVAGESVAKRLSAQLAEHEGWSPVTSPRLRERNRLAKEVMGLCDTVRRFGMETFKDDPPRRRAYGRKYDARVKSQRAPCASEPS